MRLAYGVTRARGSTPVVNIGVPPPAVGFLGGGKRGRCSRLAAGNAPWHPTPTCVSDHIQQRGAAYGDIVGHREQQFLRRVCHRSN